MWRFLILFPGIIFAALWLPFMLLMLVSILRFGHIPPPMPFFDAWMQVAPRIGVVLDVLLFIASWFWHPAPGEIDRRIFGLPSRKSPPG